MASSFLSSWSAFSFVSFGMPAFSIFPRSSSISSVFVATKGGLTRSEGDVWGRDASLDGLRAACEKSLRDLGVLFRPDVHGQEAAAGTVACLVSPSSPHAEKWETLWHYMQGGPGVFKGDLYFYRVDGDLREKVKTIDTRTCPLYLLTGEYDFSCTPEDTRRTANHIPGAEVTIMKEVGHFPMSENPAKFREYILPVLAKIAGA